MKRKRKVLKSMMSFILILTTLTACGSSSEATNETNDSNVDTSTVEESNDESEIVFRVGLHNPEQHPLCQSVAEFGEILEENSDGRMSLEIYYSGQLGDKATHLQSLQTGVLDISMIMSGVLVDYGAEDLTVFTLPYLFDSVEHARAFQASDSGQELFDSVQESGTQMVALGAYQESARNYFFTDTKVTSVEDLEGMKIRAQEGSIYSETMEAFGASPVSIAFSELYSALQTGVADGAEQPYSGFYTNQFQEICPYYLLDQHEISPNLILMSEMTWNSLSEEDKELVQTSFDESIDYFEELSDASDAEMIKGMEEAGVEIYEPDDPQEWKDAVQPIYDKYGEEYADIITDIENTVY